MTSIIRKIKKGKSNFSVAQSLQNSLEINKEEIETITELGKAQSETWLCDNRWNTFRVLTSNTHVVT